MHGPIYGSTEEMQYGANRAPFVQKKKSGSTVGVFACLFMPWVIFASVFLLTSEGAGASINSPMVAGQEVAVQGSSLTWVILFLVLAFGYAALRVWMNSGSPDASPSTWYWFLFVCSLIAWTLGYLIGQENFASNLMPYIAVTSMNNYTNVNPDVARGNQFMDAGRIYFAPGAQVDVSHSLGFRNVETFCVAPIVTTVNRTGPYDFWAVGTNCCSGHAADFACGDYAVTGAAGLRVLSDDLIGFYRLAVQQTEAHYNITTDSPMFVSWVADPQVQIQVYKDSADKSLLVGIFTYLVVQILLTGAAAIAFPKLGW